jgi:hypothetical protein
MHCGNQNKMDDTKIYDVRKHILGRYYINPCNKEVGFKALVISKSFSSLLIGCVRRPTPRTDKGSSSITNNMITFNGISVLNFKSKRYSL